MQAGHQALTVFCKERVTRDPQLEKRETEHIDEQMSASPHDKSEVLQGQSWLVIDPENITVPLRCRQIVARKIDAEKGQCLPPSLRRTGPNHN
jgi:hypothetical protein